MIVAREWAKDVVWWWCWHQPTRRYVLRAMGCRWFPACWYDAFLDYLYPDDCLVMFGDAVSSGKVEQHG